MSIFTGQCCRTLKKNIQPSVFNSFAGLDSYSSRRHRDFWQSYWRHRIDYQLKYSLLHDRALPHHLVSVRAGHNLPPLLACFTTSLLRCISPMPHDLLQALHSDHSVTLQSRGAPERRTFKFNCFKLKQLIKLTIFPGSFLQLLVLFVGLFLVLVLVQVGVGDAA